MYCSVVTNICRMDCINSENFYGRQPGADPSRAEWGPSPHSKFEIRILFVHNWHKKIRFSKIYSKKGPHSLDMPPLISFTTSAIPGNHDHLFCIQQWKKPKFHLIIWTWTSYLFMVKYRKTGCYAVCATRAEQLPRVHICRSLHIPQLPWPLSCEPDAT
jgi:hypothetical protein